MYTYLYKMLDQKIIFSIVSVRLKSRELENCQFVKKKRFLAGSLMRVQIVY